MKRVNLSRVTSRQTGKVTYQMRVGHDQVRRISKAYYDQLNSASHHRDAFYSASDDKHERTGFCVHVADCWVK